MSKILTFEQVLEGFRKEGRVLTERPTTAYYCGKKIHFTRFEIQQIDSNGKLFGTGKAIYNRRQYTYDGPQFGVFIGSNTAFYDERDSYDNTKVFPTKFIELRY